MRALRQPISNTTPVAARQPNSKVGISPSHRQIKRQFTHYLDEHVLNNNMEMRLPVALDKMSAGRSLTAVSVKI